jgi:hypothetical protein
MCYIWVNLRTLGVYVYANHNIITYTTKKFINIQSLSNIHIHDLQKKINYKTNDQKLATLIFDISNQFSYISWDPTWWPPNTTCKSFNLSKH